MLGTAKSLELIGLAAFNGFLAIILTITFLSQSDVTLNKLTETNIRNFINETTAISAGQKKDVDQFAITEYLMKHIQDGSTFTTSVQYDLPNTDTDKHDMDLDKKDYISHVIENLKTLKGQEATTNIEDIHIENGATEASVVTTSTERGQISVTGPDDQATSLPVRGVSYCEQKIILKDKTIRMAGAKCSTNIESASN